MKRSASRGVVLIVVLSVLLVLALIATVFATLQTVERSVSRNYLNEVRVRRLARAGLEHAVAEIRRTLEKGFPTSDLAKALRYYGNDRNENGIKDPGEMDPFPLHAVPLEKAQNPSLAYEANGTMAENPQNPEDGNVQPMKIKVDGEEIGFSGFVEGGTYGKNTDIYSLKIVDAGGLLFINDGVLENSKYGSVTRNLQRILNRLGDVVGVASLGDKIIAQRPPNGYLSKEDLRTVLGDSDYDKTAPFVTAYAWVDKNVVQPVPLSGDPTVLSAYVGKLGFSNPESSGPYYRGLPARFRYGRGKNRDGTLLTVPLQFAPESADPGSTDHAIWGVDEINPQWIEVCSRAPVNVNSAPREVLISLLADLQGFWVAERRRGNPSSWISTNIWNNATTHTLDAGSDLTAYGWSDTDGGDGDELGFIYSTDPIVYASGTTTSANSAAAIAEEMVACRESRVSTTSGFNYDRASNTNAWFGGPFRTWRQFYAFCDNLVSLGIVRETRSIYHYYPPPGNEPNGGGPLAQASAGDAIVHPVEAMASQAIADVIKANFNPNVHLNETNPDANFSLLVDKTDLIVMSTEGTFFPTGYFEIESLARLVRPDHNPPDALDPLANNQVEAQFKLHAVVRLYGARRFTSQKQFYGGEISPRETLPETTNGLSLEIGPEPDNGSASGEVEWDGYIALPTQGGSPWASEPGGGAKALPKPKGAVGYTAAGDPTDIGPSDNTIHAHFSYDTRAHHHADGEPRNLASVSVNNENIENRPDRTETVAGPYDPTVGPNRHRLARSFRVPQNGETGSPPAVFEEAAPLDLRIDGCYLERDANLAYWASSNSLGGTLFKIQFLTSFWMKPNFYPEVTQKPRLLWNGGRVEMRKSLWDFFGLQTEPAMLDLYFCPSHDPSVEFDSFTGGYTTWSPFRPASLLFVHTASFVTNPNDFFSSLCFGLSVATQTVPLNHRYHTSENGWTAPHSNIGLNATDDYYLRDNPLTAHRWMHVTLAMKTNWSSSDPDARIWVNGQDALYQAADSPVRDLLAWGLNQSTELDWTLNFKENNDYFNPTSAAGGDPYGDKNLLRFGQPNRVTALTWASGSPYQTRHNFACDSTIDEFLHFKTWTPETQGVALAQWNNGRYHVPRTSDEGHFTSAEFSLPESGSLRALPPLSAVSPPEGGSATFALATVSPPKLRLMGVGWTLFGETLNAVSSGLDPQMFDYNTVDQAAPARLKVLTEVYVRVDGTWYGPYTKDDYSAIVDPSTGQSLGVSDPTKLRFRVQFKWEPSPPATAILLATPYVDDLTLYYDTGDSPYLVFYSR